MGILDFSVSFKMVEAKYYFKKRIKLNAPCMSSIDGSDEQNVSIYHEIIQPSYPHFGPEAEEVMEIKRL